MNYLHEYNKLIKKFDALKQFGLVDATIDSRLEKFLFNAVQAYEGVLIDRKTKTKGSRINVFVEDMPAILYVEIEDKNSKL